MKDTTTYPLRLPNSLKKALKEAAKEDESSINQFIVMAVAEKLSAMKTASLFEKAQQEANVETFSRLLNRKGGQPPRAGDEIQSPDIPTNGACKYSVSWGRPPLD